jgi:hypothetical protein
LEEGDRHTRYRYSVTCHTIEAGVLFCLRGLCEWAAQGQHPNIARGGTTKDDWEAAGGKATFRFTDPSARKRFLDEAARLLATRWTVVGQSDHDPAFRIGKPR